MTQLPAAMAEIKGLMAILAPFYNSPQPRWWKDQYKSMVQTIEEQCDFLTKAQAVNERAEELIREKYGDVRDKFQELENLIEYLNIKLDDGDAY